MTDGPWTFNWPIFPAREDLDINPNVTTLIIKHETDDLASIALRKVRHWFKGNGFTVTRGMAEGSEAPMGSATRGAEEIRYYPDEKGTVFRLNDPDSASQLMTLIGNIEQAGVVYAAWISHGTRSFRKKRYRWEVHTGLCQKDSHVDYAPYRFYEVCRGDRLIAKALMSYGVNEMDCMAPTVQIIEVLESERGKGIGYMLLDQIELDALMEGFDSVWASDTRENPWFWEHMGYNGDESGGEDWVKYLF